MSGEEIYFFAAMGIMVLIFICLLVVVIVVIVKIYQQLRQKNSQDVSIAGMIIALMAALIGMAAVAPNFFKYSAPPKQTYAKTNLGAIFAAQVRYFGETGAYAGGPNAFSLLHWKPEGKSLYARHYAYSCGDDFIPNTRGEPIPRSAMPPEVGTSDTGFTCVAVGNIDNDPDLDYWIINDTKHLQNLPFTDL